MIFLGQYNDRCFNCQDFDWYKHTFNIIRNNISFLNTIVSYFVVVSILIFYIVFSLSFRNNELTVVFYELSFPFLYMLMFPIFVQDLWSHVCYFAISINQNPLTLLLSFFYHILYLFQMYFYKPH